MNGKRVEPENNGYLDVFNPSTGEAIAKVPLASKAEVNRTIQAAANAYPAWSQTTVARRLEPLLRLSYILRKI